MTRLCEIRVPDVGNVAEIDVVEVLIQACLLYTSDAADE